MSIKCPFNTSKNCDAECVQEADDKIETCMLTIQKAIEETLTDYELARNDTDNKKIYKEITKGYTDEF